MGSALGGHGGGSENLKGVGEGRCLDGMASLGPMAEGGRAQTLAFQWKMILLSDQAGDYQ